MAINLHIGVLVLPTALPVMQPWQNWRRYNDRMSGWLTVLLLLFVLCGVCVLLYVVSYAVLGILDWLDGHPIGRLVRRLRHD